MKVKNSMNNNIYKKRTLKVEAFKLEKNRIFPSWFIKNKQIEKISFDSAEFIEVKIRTYLGYETARQGDYIIKENNYIHACPGTIFKERYKKVEE